MQTPLTITFLNMASSEALEAKIREHAEKLEKFFPRIINCRVVMEAPRRHHHYQKGKLFEVRIDISVPGRDIAVTHSGPKNHAHEDPYVAIRDAFNAATRRLQDRARKMRNDIKVHEAPLHGKITKIFPEEEYGFVETTDGLEVYFHKNSVVGGNFGTLKPGAEVRLTIAEGEGEKGPQASTVTPTGKHHLLP